MKFTLSVEELGFAMGFLGGTDVAAGFLEAILGAQNQDNLSGRITAASHSLIARGLLTLDLATGQNELNGDLSTLVKTMMLSNRSLRCQSEGPAGERILTCFLRDDTAVTHQLEFGVVSHLTALAAKKEIVTCIVDFVGPTEGETAVNQPIAQISIDRLQTIREYIAAGQTVRAKQSLAEVLPSPLAQELADDFQQTAVTWGSILHLETDSEDAEAPLESNEGILYTALPEKLWLFQIVAENPVEASLFRGNKKQLQQMVQVILQ